MGKAGVYSSIQHPPIVRPVF